MSMSIILLAYNEASNLKILLPKIRNIVEKMGIDYEILIIDSTNPTDDTKSICEYHHVSYIPQEKPFYGGAFRTGIKYAAKDCIMFLDADGSHNPNSIPALYNLYNKGYDMVIGSRYVKGGISNDNTSSFIMSKLLNTAMKLCIGVKAKDISTSFRIYDAKQLKNINSVRNNYDVLQEVVLKMKINKKKRNETFKIGETPIIFNKRMYGESKRHLLKFIFGYIATVFILLTMNIKSFLYCKSNIGI